MIIFILSLAQLTRMHSSRMRTGRLLPVSPSMHCCCGDVPGPGGCIWFGGCVPGPGGVLGPEGCTWYRGVPGPRGVYLVPGGGVPAEVLSPCEQND